MNRRIAQLCIVATALALCWCADADDGNTADARAIRSLISQYAASVDTADTAAADRIWSHSADVSFIHPRGREQGLDQVKTDVYGHLMGETFSERKLSPRDVSVHVYGDAAWAEFNWDFVAKMRKTGAPVHTAGRETQIYHREEGQWRIVHVHYSGAPVTAEGKGF